MPLNFETPDDLHARNKPSLQPFLQTFAARYYGDLPFVGNNFEAGWLKMLDLYLTVQRYVDTQIGIVLDALEANPAVALNTIVIFTSDHGEYCGSHGLRGKSGGVYEEAIRVPLYVKDYTGRFASQPAVERTQLTSSVDIAPLLLTLASRGGLWREQPRLAHLADRPDLAAILQNPSARGRDYILYTTDEDYLEEVPSTPYAPKIPTHVIGLRTAAAKIGVNSFWAHKSVSIRTDGPEAECYDYSTTVRQLSNSRISPSRQIPSIRCSMISW